MKCPFCGVDQDKVINSRSTPDGSVVRRRRVCLACDRRYSTVERIEEHDLKVVKKDGIREPFNTQKLLDGINKACWKRPISGKAIDDMVTRIQSQVFDNYEREIPSDVLGEMIMEELRTVDQVAYVRFASVYRQFKDVHDFVDELQPMLREDDAE